MSHFTRSTVYFVQRGNSNTLATRYDGPSVIVEEWEGPALLNTGIVQKFPATPEGEQEAKELARRLNLEAAAKNLQDQYLTPAEAAEVTETAESTWRNKAAAGELPGAVKKGKQWLIPSVLINDELNGD